MNKRASVMTTLWFRKSAKFLMNYLTLSHFCFCTLSFSLSHTHTHTHSVLVVVYSCFFAESGQATTNRGDVISHAVWKSISNFLFPSSLLANKELPLTPESFVSQKRGGNKKLFIFFQTACEMTSCRCVIAWPVSTKNKCMQLYTTVWLYKLSFSPPLFTLFICNFFNLFSFAFIIVSLSSLSQL